MDMIKVKIDQIEIADNVRSDMDDEGLDALTSSIVEMGLLQPVTVNSNGGDIVRLVMGHRRVEAIRRGIEDGVLPGTYLIDAQVNNATKGDESLRTATQLVENLQREDLDPIEEAEGYATLKGQGKKQADIAQLVSRSAGHVSKRLKLLTLDADTQDLVKHGHLAVELAVELPGLEPDTIGKLARKGERLTMREVKEEQAIASRRKAMAKLELQLEKKGITVIPSRFVAFDECPDDQQVVWSDPVTKVEDLPKRLRGVVIDNYGKTPELIAFHFRKPTANEIAERKEHDKLTAKQQAAREEFEAEVQSRTAAFVENPPKAAILIGLLSQLQSRHSELEFEGNLTATDQRCLTAELALSLFTQSVNKLSHHDDPDVFEEMVRLHGELGSVPLSDWATAGFVRTWQQAIDRVEAEAEQAAAEAEAEEDASEEGDEVSETMSDTAEE